MTAEQVAEVKERFHITDDLNTAAAEADIVIEAIIEDRAAKMAILQEIGGLAPENAVIGTNSSFMVPLQGCREESVPPDEYTFLCPGSRYEACRGGEGRACV